MFSKLVELQCNMIEVSEFDPSTVDVDGLDEAEKAKAIEKAKADFEPQEVERPVRLRFDTVVAEGIGEMAGERLAGSLLFRPGGMCVFMPKSERGITTADEAIAAAREREAAEYDELRARGASGARLGGGGVLPEAARVPGHRGRRSRAAS